MFLLIATIIFAGIIAFFATQNSGPVDIRLSSFQLTGVPLYWVVLGSVLVTLVFSWIMFVINSISNSFALHGRDNMVKRLKDENINLEKKVRFLELEHAKLQGSLENKNLEQTSS